MTMMSAKYLAGDFPTGTSLVELEGKLVLTIPGAGNVTVNDAVRAVELITEESKHRVLPKLGWGAAGLVALGPLAGIAGLILAGRGTETCALCTLGDGKKLMVLCSMAAYQQLAASSLSNDAATAAAKSVPVAPPQPTLTLPIVVGVIGVIVVGGLAWWGGVFK